jgi:hypothetical protein
MIRKLLGTKRRVRGATNAVAAGDGHHVLPNRMPSYVRRDAMGQKQNTAERDPGLRSERAQRERRVRGMDAK